MKFFRADMKLMYKVHGKRIIKEFVKLECMILFIIGGLLSIGLLSGVDLPTVESILLFLLLPIIAFIIAYFVMYFGEYRPLFKEAREEIRLQVKYEYLFNKFMKID